MGGQKKDKKNKKEKKATITKETPDYEAIGAMRRRLNTLGEQVSKMSAKYQACVRESKSSKICKIDIESNHADAEKLYSRTGRLFKLQTKDGLLAKLENDSTAASQQAEKLKVTLA